MRTKLLAPTAVAGSLAMASLIWGSAQATPVPTPTQAPNKGIVTLVAHQGGGGHGSGRTATSPSSIHRVAPQTR